jgi:hypothetical protein
MATLRSFGLKGLSASASEDPTTTALYGSARRTPLLISGEQFLETREIRQVEITITIGIECG